MFPYLLLTNKLFPRTNTIRGGHDSRSMDCNVIAEYRKGIPTPPGGAEDGEAVLADTPYKLPSDVYVDFVPGTDSAFIDQVRTILYKGFWQGVKYHFVPQSEFPRDGIKVVFSLEHKPESARMIENTTHYFSYTTVCTDIHKIVINTLNWDNGTLPSTLYCNLPDCPHTGSCGAANYRKYVINHEMGHALGLSHIECRPGTMCSIMHQWTRGFPASSWLASLEHNHPLDLLAPRITCGFE